MTMLTHSDVQFKTARYSPGAGDTAATGTTNTHLAMIKRFCICALTCLMVGGAVAGTIALKTAIALSRLSY